MNAKNVAISAEMRCGRVVIEWQYTYLCGAAKMNLDPYLNDPLDEDAFLPVSGDGLANIFTVSKREKATNETLKFVPPKPSDVTKNEETCDIKDQQKTPSTRSSECLLGKAVQAYELVNGVYEPRGKLGLAIMKILNPACATLVIFNGAKATLSCVKLTKKLEVTVQNGNYITYYDEILKNWSLLLSSTQDVAEVIELLKKYDVKINDKAVQSLSEMDRVIGESSVKLETQESENYESVKNSKQSVISRMAKVGHAIILPPKVLSDQSSDTSADESSSQRNKPLLISSVAKKSSKYTKRLETQRGLTESSDSSCQGVEKVQTSSIVPVTHPNCSQTSNLFTVCNDQLVPASNSDFSNFSVFLSEARMNNTEVRMNVNRLSDKVDKVLEHVTSMHKTRSDLPSSIDFSPSFSTEIYHKLLREYEDKIKVKESVILTLQGQLQKLESSNLQSTVTVTEISEANLEELKNKKEMISLENGVLKSEVEDLRSSLALKNKGTENLISKVEQLENQCMIMAENCEKLCNLEDENKSLKDQILALEDKLIGKEIEKCENKGTSTDLVQYKDASVQCESDEIGFELKKIMNSVFSELATQFDDNQSYTGATVCTVIASVIKKTTLDALSKINK